MLQVLSQLQRFASPTTVATTSTGGSLTSFLVLNHLTQALTPSMRPNALMFLLRVSLKAIFLRYTFMLSLVSPNQPILPSSTNPHQQSLLSSAVPALPLTSNASLMVKPKRLNFSNELGYLLKFNE